MTEEGKLSRAIAKAGAAEKLSAESAHAPSRPAGAVVAPGAPPARKAEPNGLRRVRGHCGPPVSTALMFHDKAGEVASQIRALRARLMAMNRGRPPQVITISSGTREEGKSTIAFNFAVALSEIATGRVLVLDADSLRPVIHEIANVQAETGLNEIISHDLSLDGNVYETCIPDLDVIPARPTIPTNGHEGKIHHLCRPLIDKLRKHYEFIIIDTPPVMAGTQATLFGKNGDGAIVVARLESTPRHVVKRAVSELTNAGVSVIGCILTHQKHHIPNPIYRLFGTTPSHYYKYGYKYGRKRRGSKRHEKAAERDGDNAK